MSATLPRSFPIARALLTPAVTFTYAQFASLRLMEQLDATLCRLAGAEGSRKLIHLAIGRSKQDTPWMHDVQVSREGGLQELDDRITMAWTNDRCTRVTALLAHLLDLLHAVIGIALTDQLVKEAWPALANGLPATT
jgi:hypothetical protein